MAEMIVLTKEQFEEIVEEKVSNIVAGCFEKFFGSSTQKPMDAPEDRNLPILDLCSRWNISKGTVHNYVKQGLINPIKLGRRVLFPMSEVLRAEADGLTKFRKG